MITQKDVHNIIVVKAEPWQKQYLSLQCGGNPEKIKAVEQSMATIVNGIVASFKNSGTKYLNERIDQKCR